MDPRLLDAAATRDYQRLRMLIEEDPRCLARVNDQGNTLLHVAARLGDEYLASGVGDRLPPGLFSQANSSGDTALHLAARAGHVTVVSSLLTTASRECRRDPVDDLLMAANKNGDTALHEAARNRHRGVVSLLMELRPDLSFVVNKSGESPLYLAAERASLDIVSILLPWERSTGDGPGGRTALHAAVHRSYDIAKMLLNKRPELCRRQDCYQSTPLHHASSIGDRWMVRLLLEYDASVAHISDTEGLLPIHVAAAMGHVGVIQELIKTCPGTGELTSKNGRNLLHIAVEDRRPDVVKYVLKTPLLKRTINEQDYEGNTALHLAVVNRNLELVRTLLADHRVSTDTMNNKGFTPLDLASACNKSYIGLRMYRIRQALMSAGSQLSPQRLDHLVNNKRRNQEEEAIRCRAIANNLTIVAVLVATVTFAAAFTLPGGYGNDAGPEQGTAILAKKAAFRAFVVSDATAMVCSIIVIHLLIHTGSVDHDVRLHSICTSMKLMQVALAGMAVAFATGVYVATAGECKWLAILVCVLVCGIPLWMHTPLPAFEPRNLVKTCMEGKKACAAATNDDQNFGSGGGFKREDRISIPLMVKLMGFRRTLHFQTPANSELPSREIQVSVM